MNNNKQSSFDRESFFLGLLIGVLVGTMIVIADVLWF